MDANVATAILLGSFFIMVLLRFQIAYAVTISSVLCLTAQGMPLQTLTLFTFVPGISLFLPSLFA